MVIVFMGPSCTGKSSVAELIRDKTNIQIVTGKDYLRLSCSETEAWGLFLEQLKKTVPDREKSLIYLLDDTEKVQDLMRIPGVRFIKFSASLEVIQKRYELRLQGKLPVVAVKMLDTQKKRWDTVPCKHFVDTSENRGVKEVAREVVGKIS